MALVLGNIGEEMDLLIRQGGTFGPHVFTMTSPDGNPVDLTDITLRGSIRKDPTDTVSYPLTFEITDPPNGVYKLSMPAADTSALTAGPTLTHADSKYFWDDEMEDLEGNVTPLYYGKVNVYREITRE